MDLTEQTKTRGGKRRHSHARPRARNVTQLVERRKRCHAGALSIYNKTLTATFESAVLRGEWAHKTQSLGGIP